MGRSSRMRLLTAGILIAVFGTGVLVGFALDGELGAAPEPAVAEAPVEPTEGAGDEPEEAADGEEESARPSYIFYQVDPNETQLARIDSIVKEYRQRRLALSEEFAERHDEAAWEVILEGRQAIKSVLTPEQAAEYQRLLDEFDEEQEREEAARDSGDARD